jgi:enamine deaminase RidA (YjgF/YER057c/UK114 family)
LFEFNTDYNQLVQQKMPTIERSGTTRRYSDYTTHNGVIYLVEVPPNPEGDIREQTKQMLDSVQNYLEQAGSGKDCLLMATIYLCDMENDYAAMNEIWDAWVPEGTAPARACVEVTRLAHKGYKIEIAITATKK